MKNLLFILDSYISRTVPSETEETILSHLLIDKDYFEQLQILIHSREYLITKYSLEEILTNPDFKLAERLVQQSMKEETTASQEREKKC